MIISTVKLMKKMHGTTIREARRLRHLVEVLTKSMRKDFDLEKSKHIVPKKFNGGHKIWSISWRGK